MRAVRELSGLAGKTQSLRAALFANEGGLLPAVFANGRNVAAQIEPALPLLIAGKAVGACPLRQKSGGKTAGAGRF
ncbi:MAG: hypothetical protein DU429_04475 [Candidatus Tokpelaia sp.]|nr:MAG: hypothetical protein DU430_05910 [Candidatus Tokpelaia sp.]KAA6207100.1 MAG: hypothetical protein DU429_04475 [Candidatus Tokpelaia sp.]KAA6405362.1 hypothetical protein DPQ22_04680 [Candidatus Tokpelaia sp.]